MTAAGGPALFHPFAQDLGTRAAATSPTRVLKIAAGTGIAPAELMRSRMTAILGAGPVVGELAALVVSARKQA